jgi:hypothetical protein
LSPLSVYRFPEIDHAVVWDCEQNGVVNVSVQSTWLSLYVTHEPMRGLLWHHVGAGGHVFV